MSLPAGDTVMMESTFGPPSPVLITEIAARIKMAEEAGGRAWVQKRSPGMLQRGVDALPDIGGAVGGFMGITAPMRAANAARFGVAGRATSHVINTATGAELSWSPRQAVTELGKEGAKQYAAGLSGEAVAKGGRMIAPVVMKSAIGRAALGAAEKALKFGLAPTEKFAAKMLSGIANAKDRARVMARALDQAGDEFHPNQVLAPLKRTAARFKKYDVTGRETEDVLTSALKTAREKLGVQHTVTTPASVATGINIIPAQAASRTVVPTRMIKPSELQEVVQIAGTHASNLFKARSLTPGVKASAEELANLRVWSSGKKLLESLGYEGREIGRLNNEMKEMFKMHTVATRAGERAQPGISPIDWLAGSIAGTGAGVAGHNTAGGAAVGGAVALGRHLLSSPRALAAEARALNSVAFGATARAVPKVAIATHRQMTHPGVPVKGPRQ